MRLADDGIELPDNPTLRADLLGVGKRVTMNGLAIELPRTADGRHADYAPALALATSKTITEPPAEDTRPEYLSDAWYAEREKLEQDIYGALAISREREYFSRLAAEYGYDARPLPTSTSTAN